MKKFGKMLLASAVTTAAMSLPVTAVSAPVDVPENPNIVVIYTDDQGWGDVGYHGFDDIKTPNWDHLANNGVWFNQGYVSASVCGPSRTGLVTGVHQQKLGVYGNYKGIKIPETQSLIFEMMKDQGYQTAAIGKWHLGKETGLPNDRGVDFFYGFHNGSHSYIKSNTDYEGKKGEAPMYRNKDIEPPIQDSDGYLTEMFSEEAAGFIERNSDEPFFLYLAYNAVHAPWQVPEPYLERVQDLPVKEGYEGEERKFFAGMVLALDDGIGTVMDSLKEHGVYDNTLVFVMSDNGTPRGQGFKQPRQKTRGTTTMSNPGPLNGFKGDTYEGGIRVPMVMSWPGVLPEGKRYDNPVMNLDIVPTIMARFGVDAPSGQPFDGVDILPYVTGQKSADERPHDVMHWRRGEDYAIRIGDWKLSSNDQSGPETIRLYNLADDPGEWKDLVDEKPERAQQMKDQFDAWEAELPVNPYGRNFRNRNMGYDDGVRVNVAEFNAEVREAEKNQVEPQGRNRRRANNNNRNQNQRRNNIRNNQN